MMAGCLKKQIYQNKKSSGFALPTVLATSVIMMTVLVATVAITAAIQLSLKSQNNTRLLRTASEAGIVYAKACVANNPDPDIVENWTADNPLVPGDNCDSSTNEEMECESDVYKCTVLSDTENKIVTSFMVSNATVENGELTSVSSIGTIGTVRKNEIETKIIKEIQIEGGFTNKKLTVPVGWKQVFASSNHTCGVATNGSLYCWGYNGSSSYWGTLGDGSVIDSYIPIPVYTDGELSGKNILSFSTGYAYNCAVADDGKIYCWGFSNNGQFGDGVSYETVIKPKLVSSGILADKTIISVTASFWHTCAIDSEGVVYCWGLNDTGQLGNSIDNDYDGVPDSTNLPVAVDTAGPMAGKQIVSVVEGHRHTCALSSDSKLFCWGRNNLGQLGDGTTNNSSAPVEITNSGALNGKRIKSIYAGIHTDNTCAIATDATGYDRAICWGYNLSGQVGDGTGGFDPNIYIKSLPTAVSTTGVLNNKNVKSISVGMAVCALATGSDEKTAAYCWGYNASGQLGDGTTVSESRLPKAVDATGALSGKTLLAISSNSKHTCVIASDSQIYCWGDGEHGKLGNNLISGTNVPVSIEKNSILLNKKIKKISVGGFGHVCAIVSDDKPYCWGYNYTGQLGNGTKATSRIPVAVNMSGALSGKTIKQIDTGNAGSGYSCVVASDDLMYCWGDNAKGQLGNNSITQSSTPTAVYTGDVLSGLTIKSMALARDSACVIASDDEAYCWGHNESGQLGNGSTTTSLKPVKVDTTGILNGKNLVAISAGTSHVCALDSDGVAYCWGDNLNRALGNQSVTAAYSNIPVAVSNQGPLSGKKIKSISAGERFTCVVADDDHAYCWGLNDRGQLGGGVAASESFVPVKVYADILADKTVTSLSTGTYHSCLLASDKKVYCWGWNNVGQLGNGEKSSNQVGSNVPVRVISDKALNGKESTSLAVGIYNNCVIADDQAYCWGENPRGQLGNNTTIDSYEPTPMFSTLSYLQNFPYYY